MNSSKAFNQYSGCQRGLSLVELMVALALGIFIIGGALQVYLGSRRTANVVQAQSTMQEAARFAFYFINGSVRQAGYINAGQLDDGLFVQNLYQLVKASLGGTGADNPFQPPPWPAVAPFAASAVVGGVDSFSGPGLSVAVMQDADMFAVRLMGEEDPGRPDIFDCEGVPISRSAASSMAFFISADKQLYCRVDNRAPVALVSGIEDMQLQYGVASSGAANSSNRFQVEGYFTASAMPADAWPRVVALRVGLLASSTLRALDDAEQSIDLLDHKNLRFDDGRARQVFTQTIALRGNLSN